MPVRHVFVYGTLMRNLDNYHLVEPYAARIVPGQVSGKLYHLIYGYPALVMNGEQAVQGELVELSDIGKALPVLDHLEGYHGPDHPDNLYERVLCQALTADGFVVDAYVYTWSHPETLNDLGVRVSGGCWRQFMAERRDDVLDRYYFAYGSCMDISRIAASGYAGDFKVIGAACLAGWRIRLNKRTESGHATANIEAAPGHAVYGVLYRTTGRAERDYLNRREGYPQHYFKEYLNVVVGDIVFPSAVVHVARREYQADGLPVAADYAAALQRGAECLPDAYRQMLQRELDQ